MTVHTTVAPRVREPRRWLLIGAAALLAVVIAAVAVFGVPAASAATPQYDGYKSGYPQLRQILSYQAAAAHHAAAPAAVLRDRGFAWRDAGIGLLVGVLGGGLITVSLSQLRRNRTAVLL